VIVVDFAAVGLPTKLALFAAAALYFLRNTGGS
jgi:hypothetical protein